METKQQLKDRIAELELAESKRKGQIQLIEYKWSEEVIRELEGNTRKAILFALVLAAYALALTIWVVV